MISPLPKVDGQRSAVSGQRSAVTPLPPANYLIVLFFFSTTEILAKYKLLLGQIIFLFKRDYISCFIFFYIGGSKVFDLAIMKNEYIRYILYLRKLIFFKSLLQAITIFLNQSNNFLSDLNSYLANSLVFKRYLAKYKHILISLF